MLSAFISSMGSDLRVLARQHSTWINSIIFFIIFISLFGIGLGQDNQTFLKIAPGIIWIAFLITTLLGMEAFLAKEKEEGVLEQLLLSPHPLWWLMLAKALTLWVATCFPLIMVIPVLGISMSLSLQENGILLFSILIGSPALTLIGMIGASLTITLNRSGMLLGLLLLPLYIPVLLLGESAAAALISSTKPLFQMAMLAAISIFCLTLSPHAAAWALKATMD